MHDRAGRMRVFLIAGEPSGDRLGGALMAGLRALRADVAFDGIGGPAMRAEGLMSRFPMDELSVMGIAEVLPRYRALKRRIDETAQAVIDTAPDILVTIDSPDFCLRVARRVKARRSVHVVHYVAPTVWAWRAGRARKMAGVVDQVLALFPFEPPYMEAAGLPCDFVGHPAASEPVATAAEAQAFRDRHRIAAGPLVLALPGSRRAEVTRLAPVFGAALAAFLRDRPGARVAVPAAAPVADLVARLTADWPGDPVLIDPRDDPGGAGKRAAFRAADVALAASGTVSLELAAAATPMVIAYDMNWLSRRIIAAMLKVDTVTLVNLVSETRAVPEFIGANCRPGPIAAGLEATLAAPGAQQAAMAVTMLRLGAAADPPGLRAARAILARMDRPSARALDGFPEQPQ